MGKIGEGMGKIGEGTEGTSVLGWPLQLWPTVSIFCSSFCGRYSKRLARPYMPSLIVTGSVLSVDGSWYAYTPILRLRLIMHEVTIECSSKQSTAFNINTNYSFKVPF